MLVGRATRIARYILTLPKTYVTTARYGALSSTGDPDGEIVQTGRIPPDPPPLPTGEVRQRPPAYSAIRIAGVRAYERARRGEEVEMPERLVHVHRFEQLWREDGERGGYEIECGSGTYIRSLVAELGDAYCESLRRTEHRPLGRRCRRRRDADPARATCCRRSCRSSRSRASRRGARATARSSTSRPTGRSSSPTSEGPICIAEPREGGGVKASVGFRG